MERLSNYLIEKLVLNKNTKIRMHKHRYTQEDFKELKDFNEFFNADFDDELISIHLGEAVDHENNGLCCWSFIEYWNEDFSGYENDPDCFLIFNDEQFDFFIEEYKPETNMRMYNYEAPQWLYDKLFDIGLDNSFGQSFYLYIVKLDDFLDNEIIKGVAKVEKFKRAIKKVKDKLK